MTITNAWAKVMYGKKSTPNKSWVEREDNLKRLQAEIGHVSRWLFCFGDQAFWAAEALEKARDEAAMAQRENGDRLVGLHSSCKIIRVRHLSPRKLAGIPKDLSKVKIPDSKEIIQPATPATYRRLEVIAGEMARHMGYGRRSRQRRTLDVEDPRP